MRDHAMDGVADADAHIMLDRIFNIDEEQITVRSFNFT